MKKTFISIITALMALGIAYAVPADPTPFKYVQPDGSIIILHNHGDEYCHWLTDDLGRVVAKGADGYYRPTGESIEVLMAQGNEARAQENRIWSSYDNAPETNFGDVKILCFIAEFPDKPFSVSNPYQHFSNMLNKSGYSFNGAIGSVRDYYIDNSGSQYRPEFDVYGPVTLSHELAYYDNRVPEAILEAYSKLAGDIDLNKYDNDHDGYLDMVLFYYAGYNEAENGPAETIWPHQSTGNFGMMGDKHFFRYFCTSELSGNEGSTPASIGTTCHEFAHSLGLPDFYDTDYATGGQNLFTTGHFDLMSSGNYNDSGRKPPYLSVTERNMLGWMPAPASISAAGNYTLGPVYEDQGYIIQSGVEGEYFVLERRVNHKWDSALPAYGLLVYHVDKSSVRYAGSSSYTPKYLWENTNKINAWYPHPCYYLLFGSSSDESLCVLPGDGNITNYAPLDWDGNSVGLALSHIALNGANCTFTVSTSSQRTVYGNVLDSDNNPIVGAEVSLTPSDTPFAGAPALSSGSIYCITDSDGYYSITLEDTQSEYQILTARKSGYTTACENLTISSIYTPRDIRMLRVGEGAAADLYKYDSTLSLYNLGVGGGVDTAVGMRYTASELSQAGLVGATIKTVHFYMRASDSSERIYVVIDSGSGQLLRKDVTSLYTPNKWNIIDISSHGITIPEGEDLYIGAGISGVVTQYPFSGFGPVDTNNGGCVVQNYFLEEGNHLWHNVTFSGHYIPFAVAATVIPVADVDFATLGVSYIKVVNGVPTAVPAAGKSLKSVTWTLDGGEASDSPTAVTDLSAGSHTYMARLQYYDGSVERVFFDLDVE